jgi:hypothetical protein
MSKIKQIDSHSAGAGSDELRWRGSVVNLVLPPQQRTLRHSSASPVDDNRKAILFHTDAGASRQTLSLRSWDTTGGSNVILFRAHHHGPRSWEATAKSHEENAIRSRKENFGKHEGAIQGDDDHGHRMFANLLAAAVSILLIITGDWMVSTLVKMP